MIGYTPEEVLAIQNSVSQLIHPEDMPAFMDFLHIVIEEKEEKVHHVDYRIKSRSLNYHWMRSYAVVYKRDSNGKATQLLGMDFNVSVEKEKALALIKRERQLLDAQAIGKIGSFEWDIVNDTSITSPELLKIFEADQRQKLEEMLQNVHPDDREKVRSALSEAFQNGIYECEYRYSTKTGEKVIQSNGVVTFDQERKPVTMIGTIQDITEHKRIEESLIKNTMELQRSNAQLQEFAFVASHDLKEPLRKIGMFSNIIMTSEWDKLPERTKTNIQKISDSAIRMQKLIEGILTYSSFTIQQSKERVSLEQLFNEALVNLEYKIRETNAVISSDGLPEAVVISFQMQQLFQNLIGNALKFSKKIVAPQVKVTHAIIDAIKVQDQDLQPAKKYLQIQVNDNGIGFSPEAASKIFGLFQRLHGRSDYEGSGLGLAICKRIMENHDGVISASSQLGEGSTFTIILPFL